MYNLSSFSSPQFFPKKLLPFPPPTSIDDSAEEEAAPSAVTEATPAEDAEKLAEKVALSNIEAPKAEESAAPVASPAEPPAAA